MPESEAHRKLRDQVAAILEANGWSVSHDNGDTTRPDIVATKDSKRWLIEIEWSGSNIERDLEQGAETFVTTPDKLEEIRRKVGGRAQVVDLDGFRRKKEAKS